MEYRAHEDNSRENRRNGNFSLDNQKQFADDYSSFNHSERFSSLPIPSKIILRQSIFCIIAKLIGIEFFFDCVYFIFRFILTHIPIDSTFQTKFAIYYTIFFILLNIGKVTLFIFVGLKWVTSSYKIKQGEITYKTGIFFRSQKVYMCTNTQEVICSQGIFGRLCNFGTVEIFNPAIKNTISLDSIQNPRKYAKIIKENILGNINAHGSTYITQI